MHQYKMCLYNFPHENTISRMVVQSTKKQQHIVSCARGCNLELENIYPNSKPNV